MAVPAPKHWFCWTHSAQARVSGLLGWSCWPPYLFHCFHPLYREAKNCLAVVSRPNHPNLGHHRCPGRGRPPPARGRKTAVCRRQCPRPNLPRSAAGGAARPGAALLPARIARGPALPARPAPAPRWPVQNRPEEGLDSYYRRAVHHGRPARLYLARHHESVCGPRRVRGRPRPPCRAPVRGRAHCRWHRPGLQSGRAAALAIREHLATHGPAAQRIHCLDGH